MSSFFQNIRLIAEEIVSSEHADVNLALVEYRDHPPQDDTFITRVHDFTPSVRTMKGWLEDCSAAGGMCHNGSIVHIYITYVILKYLLELYTPRIYLGVAIYYYIFTVMSGNTILRPDWK